MAPALKNKKTKKKPIKSFLDNKGNLTKDWVLDIKKLLVIFKMAFIETLNVNVHIFRQCMLQYSGLHDYYLLLNGSTTTIKKVKNFMKRGIIVFYHS